MGWKVDDFICLDCGHEFEELYKDGEELVCASCSSSNLEKKLSMPGIGAFSAMPIERRAETLKKRSEEHTAKEIAKEPERFGEAGVERYQATRTTSRASQVKK